MPFTAHCLAFFALVSTVQEPAPVEAPRFVLTIVDDLGQPLGDIPVQLGMSQTSPGRSQWHALGSVPRRTDAGGRLALEPRRAWTPGATLAVNLREANVAGDHYRHPEVPWDGGAGACTLVVPRPGWIVGRVTRRATSDRVFASFGRGERGYGSALDLDADGRFRIGPIAAGRHAVKFHYVRAEETVVFDVAPGVATDEVLVDLNRGGWIIGRVVDHEGHPLDGHLELATPELLDLRVFDVPIPVEAPEGRFVAGPLPAGPCPIQFYPRGSGSPLAHAWVDVPESGEVEVELRTPGPAIEVTGIVRRGGAALVGMGVELRAAGTYHEERTVTDAEGRYRLSVPRPGPYDVRAGAYRVGEVGVSGPRHVLDVTVPANALVIEPPSTGDPTRTWNFDIRAIDVDARSDRGTASTEHTLRPRVEGLAPGRYRVNARQGPEVLSSTCVSVPDAGEVTATFAVDRRGRMVVDAVDADGNSVTAHTAQCLDSNGLWASSAGELMPGKYDLWVTAQGLAGFGFVEVVAGATVVARVTVAPAATLEVTGELLGSAVPPLLQLVDEHGHRIDALEMRHVNGPGRVRIDGIPAGRYRLCARVPGAAWRERALVLTGGQHVALALRFD